MRLLFAIIYIIVGLSAYGWWVGDNPQSVVFAIWFLFLLFSSVLLFNEGGLRRLMGQSHEQYLQKRLSKGTAVQEHYVAHQAITFDDQRTGCLCHLIALENNTVLCLYCQSLYLYTEVTDDGENNQERQFPTKQFSLIRDSKTQAVLQLIIGDAVIEEIKIDNPNIPALQAFGFKLEDGEVVHVANFEMLKQALQSSL